MNIRFQGKVTDAGQYVSSMTIHFDHEVKPESVTIDTFKVYMISTVAYGELKGQPYPYYKADEPLKVVKKEVNEDEVKIYFAEDQACTSTWLKEGRNHPAELHFTIEQNAPITVYSYSPDHRKLESQVTYEYTCDASSWKDLEDPEIEQFEAVDLEDGVSYQFHKGTNNKLIVWFHGNGEGDFEADGAVKQTGNNISQILCNRGGTAWVSEEAQNVFGDANVVAFQAPSMWYYAVKNDHALLKLVKLELDEIIEDNEIDPDQIYVAGCSAGGFMCTRMIIDYPDLFRAAMISCPALDVANLRAGVDDAIPTDEELLSIRDSRTAIWLVQGKTDSVVEPKECAIRIWNKLIKEKEIVYQDYEGTDGIASSFRTYETVDNKYKLTLYETADVKQVPATLGGTRAGGSLCCAEDYDQDGFNTLVKYNDHWSWIFTLRNNPESLTGDHIFEWAADWAEKKVEAKTEEVIAEEEKKQESTMELKDLAVYVLAAAAGLAAGVLVGSLLRRKK